MFQKLEKRRAEANVSAFIAWPPLERVNVSSSVARPSETCFESSLHHWKDLCAAEHFQNALREVKEFIGSLAKIVNYKETIFETFLKHLLPEAFLSWEAIMEVLAALSNDLQDLFVPFLPPLLKRVEELTSASSRQPELLKVLFESISKIMKSIQKHLVNNLVEFLTMTIRPLIVHPDACVQRLTCQSMTHVLRLLTKKKLKLALKCVMGVICMHQGSEAILKGYASFVAHVCMGVQNSLHSKCKDVLSLLLSGKLINASQIKIKKPTFGDIHVESETPEWLDEAYIWSMTTKLLDLMFDLYLLPHMQHTSSIEMWEILIACAKEKAEELESEWTNETDAGLKGMRELAFCTSIITKMTSYKKCHLIPGVKEALRFVEIVTNDSWMTKMQLGRPSECKRTSSFAFELVLLMVRLLSLNPSFRNDRCWIDILSKASASRGWVRDLSPSESIEIGRAILPNVSRIGILAWPLMERFVCFVKSGDAVELEEREEAFVLLDQFLQSLSIGESSEENELMKHSLLPWLKQTAQQWPYDTFCQNSSAVYSRSSIALGWVLTNVLSSLFPTFPEETIESLSYFVENLEMHHGVKDSPLSASDVSFLLCHSKIALAKIEALYAERKGSASYVTVLVRHLRRVMRSYEGTCVNAADLKCISSLVSQIQQEKRNKAKSEEIAEMDLDEAFKEKEEFDFHEIFHNKEMKKWISISGSLLKDPESKTRRSALELLSVFELLLFPNSDPSKPGLFSSLLEVENHLVPRISHRAIGLIEEVRRRIEENIVPEVLVESCFDALLGQLYIPFKPIWQPISKAVSAFLDRHFSDFWPMLLVQVDREQAQLLTPEEPKTIQSLASLTPFEKCYEKVIQAENFRDRRNESTEHSIVLIHLLQSIKESDPMLLKRHLSEWTPFVVQWLQQMTSSYWPKSEESRCMKSEEWLQVAHQFLGTLSRIPSLDSNDTPLLRALHSALSGPLQKPALDLLQKFDLKGIALYKDVLLKMLSKSEQVQRVMLHFRLSPDDGSLDREHRNQIVPIVIHLLFRIVRNMNHKKKLGNPILNYLSNLDPYELAPLIELCFLPYQNYLKLPETQSQSLFQEADSDMFDHGWWYPLLNNTSWDFWIKNINAESLTCPEIDKILKLVDRLIFNMGHKLLPYLSFLMAWIINILERALKDRATGSITETMVTCVNLMTTLAFQFPDICDDSLYQIVFPMLIQLTSYLQSRPQEPRNLSIVKWIQVLMTTPNFVRFVYLKPGQLRSLLYSVFALLKTLSIPFAINNVLLELADRCIEHEELQIGRLDDDLLQSILQGLQNHITMNFSNSTTDKERVSQQLGLLERILKLRESSEAIRAVTLSLMSILTKMRHGDQNEESSIAKSFKCLQVLFQRSHELAFRNEAVFEASELWSIVSTLSKKASKYKSHFCRSNLAEVFISLSFLLPSLEQTAEMFVELTSLTENRLENIDYDRRLEAYQKMTSDFWSQGEWRETELLIHACLFDLINENDFILRQASSSALQRRLALCKQSGCLSEKDSTTIHILACHISLSLGVSNLAVRQELLSLLWRMIELDKETFHWAKSLFSMDREQDFFHNVAHFQIPRRIKAWKKLWKCLKRSESETETEFQQNAIKINKFLGPLLFQTLFDTKPKSSHPKKLTKTNPGQESSLAEVCVDVLSSIASNLPWPLFRKLTQQLVKRMGRTPQPTKGMIKALCVIVDAHQSETNALSTIHNSDLNFEAFGDAQMMVDDGDQNRVQEENQEVDGAPKRYMVQKVAPLLENLLFQNNGQKARSAVAMSLAKLYSNSSSASSELPSLLLKMARLLVQRKQTIRDEAKNVYVSMASSLGSAHLTFCLRSLISALSMKGYTAHVLDHAIYAVMEGMKKSLCSEDVDHAFGSILPILETSLFGEPSEERLVDVFSKKYKEAKTTKSDLTLGLLFEYVTFQKHIPELLRFIEEKFSLCDNTRHRAIVESLLEKAVSGMLANKTALLPEKLNFIYRMITEVLIEEKAFHPILQSTDVTMLDEMQEIVQQQKRDIQSKYRYFLLEFGICFLKRSVKPMNRPNLEDLEAADPFVPLLIQCLHTRHGKVASLALKCLCQWMILPFPSLKDHATEVGRSVIQLLDSVPNTNDEVAQDCLKLLAKILHNGETFQPTHFQINALLTVIATDLEEQGEQQAPFKLLRSILDRKFIVPKVYDLMSKVREIMIRSQSIPMRQMVASLFLQFLSSFPLSEQQLDQHLFFVLSNLSYEYESENNVAGRKQALDFMFQIVTKFPIELLNEKHGMFYVVLVERLFLEPEAELKSKTVEILNALLSRLSDKDIIELIKMNLNWMQDPTGKLRLAGIHGMSVLLNKHPKLCASSQSSIIEFCHTCFDTFNSKPFDEEEDSEWKEIYGVLHLLEKLCSDSCPLLNPSFLPNDDIWNAIVGFTSYPHLWVRAAASRLIGMAFQAMEPHLESFMTNEIRILLGGRTAPQLAFDCYLVMETDSIEAAMALQCCKNLVWLAPILIVQSPSVLLDAEGECIDYSTDAMDDTFHGLSFFGILRRMSKMANHRGEGRRNQRIAAFKFIGALGLRLQRFGYLNEYLSVMLEPIFSTMESKETTPKEQEAKETAQEVMEYLQTLTEQDFFINAYAEARKIVESIRIERRRRTAVQKVLDPEGAAARRLKRNRRVKESKKRKAERLAVGGRHKKPRKSKKKF